MRIGHSILPLTVLVLAACAASTAPPPVAPPPVATLPPPASAARGATCRLEKPTACAGASPSFARDVTPILEHRCFACHANGGVATDDHDFSHLSTLRAQRSSVLAEVSACAMPPSDAEPLLASEAEVLLRWAACGAPEN